MEAAKRWHALPHRSLVLWDLIAQEFLPLEISRDYFAKLRQEWHSKLVNDAQPSELKLLIERIRPDNYEFELKDGKWTIKSFRWPEEIERETAEDLRRVQNDMTKMTLPHSCRDILSKGQRFADTDIPGFLSMLKELGKEPREQLDRHGEPLRPIEDCIIGGICVLMMRHLDWLVSHDTDLNWCRSALEGILRNPPRRSRFMTDRSHIEDHWEGFAADIGIYLLAQDSSDQLARRLVASSVAGFYYGTTATVMNRAFECREKLGDDFGRLQRLAAQWAALRAVIHGTPHIFKKEHQELENRRHALMTSFDDRSLSSSMPDIVSLDDAAQIEIVAARIKQFPESARHLIKKKPRNTARLRQREKIHRKIMGLDDRVLSASFSWLASISGGSANERQAWLSLMETFLGISLDYIPKVDSQTEEIGGLPSDYDSWVFQLIASVVPLLTPNESPKRFWLPILDIEMTAHDWVERFFLHWFTNGFRASQDLAGFFDAWRDMIGYALDSPHWELDKGNGHDLGGKVLELLGLDCRWDTLSTIDAAASEMTELGPLFERAANKWFKIPRVLQGFIVLAGKPIARGLALPGIKWTYAAVQTFDDYDWRHGLQESLVDFLGDCWNQYGASINNDVALRTIFLSLLTTLTARGSHAALSLSARVAGNSSV